MKKIKILLILPLIALITGCYNYRELDDLGIVSAVSITLKDNMYQLSFEVINPKKEQDASGANEPDFIIYTSKATSLQEAFRLVTNEAPSKLYGGQLEILIIDEAIALNGLEDILDFLARDPEIRNEFYVLVSKSDKVLEITTPLVNISSQNIIDSLKANNKYLGTANLVTYHNLISTYLNSRKEITLPSIELLENNDLGSNISNISNTKSTNTNKLSNIGVFKNNKLIGYLTEEESLFYNVITNNANTFLVRSDYDDKEYIVNEVINSKTSTKIDIKKNKVTISIKGKSAISEVNLTLDLNNKNNIQKIQKKLNKDIEEKVKNMINTVQKDFNSDIFGFEDSLYKENPKVYKKIKDKWNLNIFKNLEVEVNSNITIFEKGNLIGGIKS